MNQLTTVTEPAVPTMSSLEIVKYINDARKQLSVEVGNKYVEMLHKSFITKLEKHPAINSAKFFAQYIDSTGRSLKCYNLPEREAKLMVMSESLVVQAQVYDHMKSLEEQVKKISVALLPDFSDPYQAALAWAEQYKKTSEVTALLEVAKVDLAEAEPKVEFHDAVVAAKGVLTFGDAAKSLKIGRQKFINWLKDNKYIQRDRVPYQVSIDNGWLESSIRPQFVTDSGKIVPPTTYVTGKGIVYFQRKLTAK